MPLSRTDHEYEYATHMGNDTTAYLVEGPPWFSGGPIKSGRLAQLEAGDKVHVIRYDPSDDSYLVSIDEDDDENWWVDCQYLTGKDPNPPVSEEEMAEVMQLLGVQGAVVSQEAARIEEELPKTVYVCVRGPRGLNINAKAFLDPVEARTAAERDAFNRTRELISWAGNKNGWYSQTFGSGPEGYRYYVQRLEIT